MIKRTHSDKNRTWAPVRMHQCMHSCGKVLSPANSWCLFSSQAPLSHPQDIVVPLHSVPLPLFTPPFSFSLSLSLTLPSSPCGFPYFLSALLPFLFLQHPHSLLWFFLFVLNVNVLLSGSAHSSVSMVLCLDAIHSYESFCRDTRHLMVIFLCLWTAQLQVWAPLPLRQVELHVSIRWLHKSKFTYHQTNDIVIREECHDCTFFFYHNSENSCCCCLDLFTVFQLLCSVHKTQARPRMQIPPCVVFSMVSPCLQFWFPIKGSL